MAGLAHKRCYDYELYKSTFYLLTYLQEVVSITKETVTQPWAWAAHPYCGVQIDSAFHPPWDEKMTPSFGAE